MVFPRIERWSRVCGFLPLTVSLTDFKCVFMLTSTPVRERKQRGRRRRRRRRRRKVSYVTSRAQKQKRAAFAKKWKTRARRKNGEIRDNEIQRRAPKIVPEHVVPFFNSIVTVSLFNFWRNFTSFIVRVLPLYSMYRRFFMTTFNF